jgi:glycyl-tRNA synthetase
MAVTMDQMVSLAKRRGFVFPGSEIYGGLANAWDYGPLGVELKNNIKRAWWKNFVQDRPDVVGLDSAILMNPRVWEASGHVAGFSDPLVDCRACKSRHRADKLIEEWYEDQDRKHEAGKKTDPGYEDFLQAPRMLPAAMTTEELHAFLVERQIKCPTCGKVDYTPVRKFNLMFKTHVGVIENEGSLVYLRPETAQGIFVNFKNVQTVSRKRVPFGIGQIGKSFRNEITPGNFIFRTREFEQMELEFFCRAEQAREWFQHWKDFCMDWLLKLGMKRENLRVRDHSKEELSHYSQATSDIEYRFPFGWGELWGIAHRGNFDLTQHQEFSKKELAYVDPETNEKFLPHVVEPALGVDRLALAFLLDCHRDEEVRGETRNVLGFHPRIAPIKCAVLPLSRQLGDPAMKVFEDLRERFPCDYDDAGSIGRRYRRQDEVGTPYCVTIDFETLNDQEATVRDRDTMAQDRIPLSRLGAYLEERIPRA